MVPAVVAWGSMAGSLERVGSMLCQPSVNVVEIELLGPKHAPQCLPHDVGRVCRQRRWNDGGIELICLLLPRLHCRVEATSKRSALLFLRRHKGRRCRLGESQTKSLRLTRTYRDLIVRRSFRPILLRI